MAGLPVNDETSPREVTFAQALAVWAKIGLLSFGGPAGQIALMHRILVDERRWLGEARFAHALNFCMLLPGPEAMQLATYSGWLLHGWRGGLAAGLLFVLPGALVVGTLAAIYALFGETAILEAVFFGVKAAVLAIVLEALLKISRRALKGPLDWAIAAAAFAAIYLLGLPFPLIVLAAALIGFVRRGRPPAGTEEALPDRPVSWRASLGTGALWLAVWWLPLLALAAFLGPHHVLAEVGWFFSKLAVVTFGGAYAVLAYMAQQAVENHGWLTAEQMLDGLGLAETTPGPLILVNEFVGFLGGYGEPGLLPPLAMGVAAALVALWATFVPCFLWIFLGAPHIERLRGRPRLKGALAAVTAAVVGVILNLSLWFGVQVLFARTWRWEAGPLSVLLPEPASIDWAAFALFALACGLLFALHRGLIQTLALCALLGAAWKLWLAS